VRYVDDGLGHCRSKQEAESLKAELRARLAECGLEMHPTKTKMVYCKDGKRKGRTRMSRLTFWETNSGRERSGALRTTKCSVASPRGQPRGTESHTIDGAGLEYPTKDVAFAGPRRSLLTPGDRRRRPSLGTGVAPHRRNRPAYGPVLPSGALGVASKTAVQIQHAVQPLGDRIIILK
jgi:hypothetical protein